MRKISLALACALLFPLAETASAKAPIVDVENGASMPISRQGLIGFAEDYAANPRDLTLVVLDHPFGFQINAPGCGAGCTQFIFTSSELGIKQTFNGVNTAD